MINNPVYVKKGGAAVDELELLDETNEVPGIKYENNDPPDYYLIPGLVAYGPETYPYTGGAVWIPHNVIDECIAGRNISINIEVKENRLCITFTYRSMPEL